jgi:hypothetical protein
MTFIHQAAVAALVAMGAATVFSDAALAQRKTIPTLLKDGYRIVLMNSFGCHEDRNSAPCFYFLLEKDRDYFLCERTLAVTAGQPACTHVD